MGCLSALFCGLKKSKQKKNDIAAAKPVPKVTGKMGNCKAVKKAKKAKESRVADKEWKRKYKAAKKQERDFLEPERWLRAPIDANALATAESEPRPKPPIEWRKHLAVGIFLQYNTTPPGRILTGLLLTVNSVTTIISVPCVRHLQDRSASMIYVVPNAHHLTGQTPKHS